MHLDFVDDLKTFDQSDKALGMCFAYVERAARTGCRTSVALRSQDPSWSHRILHGLMKTPESRQCGGGLLDWDSHCLGLVMIWVSQEVCDVLEVAQEGSVGVITVRRLPTLLRHGWTIFHQNPSPCGLVLEFGATRWYAHQTSNSIVL